MPRNRGFTIIEMLIVVAIICIIAAIAIPTLIKARVSNVANPFKTHFGVDITEYAYARASEPPDRWLTDQQKAVMRPYVQQRLSELCTTPPPTVYAPSPALDPATVQLRLHALSQEGSSAESKAKACGEATTVVHQLGILPAEAAP